MTPANGLDRALRLDASVTADALAADGTGVLTRLGGYRGQSRFAVWVAKFAIHEAAATTREIAAGRRKAKAAGDTNPPAPAQRKRRA